ncbi:MAG TPA: hypothetical protein VN626_04220, partial [Clostridia bacterium]|nr:hypothetical protein [Clostridia bacterium]
MKNILKKFLVVVTCIALCAALMGVGVLADSSSSQGQRGDKPGMQQGGGKGGPGGAGEGDMSLTQIKEKIAALTDTSIKADLTSLLEAYEDALAAEKMALEASSSTTQDALDTLKKATSDARNALASALTTAGIDIMNQRGNADGDKNGQQNTGDNRGGVQSLDVDTIEELIADLDDDDTQDDLTELLEAYEDALAAEKSGMSNTSLTEDAKKTLREAVSTAAKKLTTALTDAGIDQNKYASRPDNSGSGAPPEQPGDVSSTSSSDSSSTAKV